jgi:hypothetical protein
MNNTEDSYVNFCVFFSVEYIGVELLGHMITLCLAISGASRLKPGNLVTFPLIVHEGYNFSISSATHHLPF